MMCCWSLNSLSAFCMANFALCGVLGGAALCWCCVLVCTWDAGEVWLGVVRGELCAIRSSAACVA